MHPGAFSDLEGGRSVQFGGVDSVHRNVGDVGDELLQKLTALLQVGGVDDHLHQLETPTEKKNCYIKIAKKQQ